MTFDPFPKSDPCDFYSYSFAQGARDDTLILNMGPQHPSTHGVLRILLELDGEYIVRAEPVLGYIHRMHELMGQNRSYAQYLPNMGRVDYLHALAWNWAYVGAVEQLAEIEVPERAEYIRVLTCEMNRLTSHMLWWGAYLLDLGAFTPIMYAFADREILLDLLQRVTGSRLTYCYYRFGGVYMDIDEQFASDAREFIKLMRKRLPMYEALVTKNFILRKRCEEIGVMSAEMARDFGCTGPVIRGSGVAYDVRRAQPYSVYPELDFEIPTYPECDAMARYMVRLAEMEQSMRIIEQCLDKMPEGDIQGKVPKTLKPPKGETYFAVEGARGKIGLHLVSDGTAQPYRIKLRAPGFCNLSCFAELSKGTLLSDAVSILGSLDLVIPEIDR
ncbi:MAG: NADH-quinone oxidoreductase subunit D [Desulfovibrionaceae bacterium]